MTRLRRYGPVPGSGVAAHCRPIHLDSVVPPPGEMITLEELAELFEAARRGVNHYIIERDGNRMHFDIGFGLNGLYVILRHRDNGTTE